MLQSVYGGVKGLSPQHLKNLENRGLDHNTIKASGVFSEANPLKIADLLNMGGNPAYGAADRLCPHPLAVKMAPCLVLLYYHLTDANGEPLAYVRVRPDNPLRDPKRDRYRKYEGPRGERSHLYFPPGIINAFADVSIPLTITEGEFKALMLCQHGFPAIGIPGVAMWGAKGRGYKDRRMLHEDLMRIAWRDRLVIVLFDADIHTNPNVAREAKALRACLRAIAPHEADCRR